jgi:hypothetical protein
MTETELINWLKQQHSTLDKIVANAAREFHSEALKNRAKEDFGFDLAECQNESYNLINNKDLCYDRPNTPLVYSLWYHGRRVNTFLSYFAKTIFNTPETEKEIEIFDLGAGTGAVQWAIGLVYHKMKEAGRQVPKIKIVNVDTSPFMLYYSRDYLWKHFISEYKLCQDFNNEIEYEINSWSNSHNVSVTNPWITASYLFDFSDTASPQANSEYKESVKTGFRELVKTFSPAKIMLLTSTQKKSLLDDVKEEFIRNGYNQSEIGITTSLFNGYMQETSKVRKELYELYKPFLLTKEARSLGNYVAWNEPYFIGTILTKQQSTLNLLTPELKKEKKEIKIYNPPITVRRDIVLNDEQKKSAEHSGRPTIITGPAGCGKSVVITERIRNLVKENNYDVSLRILVTTFNKQLMSYLGNWIADLLSLDKVEFEKVGNNFKFKNSKEFNIRLMHFDILPTQLGIGLRHLKIGSKQEHYSLIQQCINDLKKEKGITTSEYDRVLNPTYILDEYHRIIYGLMLFDKKLEDYLAVNRTGRPKLGEVRRKLLWDVIINKYLKRKQNETFITKRQKFLEQLKSGKIKYKFSHIFVDEFQDCTLADYEIFFSLLSDYNNLVIAGDVAQAIKIGKSVAASQIPRKKISEGMRRREFITLKGSYRVPFRIVEAIQRITSIFDKDNIDEYSLDNLLTPYKGSPPGARPIIVYAATFGELKNKIETIYKTYSVYDIDKVTILEKEDDLVCQTFRSINIPCKTETILKLKGLEKNCVLWTTRKDVEHKDLVPETVYTILTRTSGLLIIILSSQTLPKYYKIIKLLRKDRLIFWDKETKDKFNDFCLNVNDDEANDDNE